MLPAGATSAEDLPAVGQTSRETLANLRSAYEAALSDYKAKAASRAKKSKLRARPRSRAALLSSPPAPGRI